MGVVTNKPFSSHAPYTLKDFLNESNLIEGLVRTVTPEELEKAEAFLALPTLTVKDVENIVNLFAGAHLRRNIGDDVRVGRHHPLPGGGRVEMALEDLLGWVNQQPLARRANEAYQVHQDYETLHPFMDGNGRSGRLIWLWMMGGINNVPLGFLHTWYYQSLHDYQRGGD